MYKTNSKLAVENPDAYELREIMKRYYSNNVREPEAEQTLIRYKSELTRTALDSPPPFLVQGDRGAIPLIESMTMPFTRNMHYELAAHRSEQMTQVLLTAMEKHGARNDHAMGEFLYAITTHDSYGVTPLIAAAQSGDQKLYAMIAGSLGKHWKKLGKDAYAAAFKDPGSKNMTLVHAALIGGNPAIYASVMETLATLRKANLVDETDMVKQFTLPLSTNQTPLLSAIGTGQPKLLKAFLDDFDALPLSERKQALQVQGPGNWNSFHNAMKPLRERNLPDPVILDRLQSSYFKAFDPEEARQTLETLYKQINNMGFAAANSRNAPEGSWERRILEASDERPLNVPH